MKRKVYKISSIVILSFMFVFMCLYASKQSFWVDELDWTIDFLARPSFIGMLKDLLMKGYNLPLYYIVMFPIYKIVPYGELWLLLPNIIAVIVGLIFLKKVGEKIGGEDLGFVSLCLGATSYILIYQGAFELRPYAFLFCLSAISLYYFLCHLENNSRKNNILYTIFIILLAYTHWFGCLAIVFYFIVDVIFWLKKKQKLSFMFPYITLGVFFLPWFISTMRIHTSSFSEYWVHVPGISAIIGVVTYLSSNLSICRLLFILSVLFIFIYIYISKSVKKYIPHLICIGTIIFIIITIFIYSKFINPKGSLFFERYFFVILPHILLVTSFIISEIMNLELNMSIKTNLIKIKKLKINYKLFIPLVILIFIFIGYKNYSRVHKEMTDYYEPYREASNFVAANKDAYNKKSALMLCQGTGYLTYYFEKQGNKLPNTVFTGCGTLIKIVDDSKKINNIRIEYNDLLNYDTLFLVAIHNYFNKEVIDFISENYDILEDHLDIGLRIYTKKN